MNSADIEHALARRFAEGTVAGVVSAYLYGSHVEGRAHAESDIDVGVLLDRRVYPTDRKRFEQRLLLVTRLAAGLEKRPLDLVVLNDCPPLLARRIVTHGHRLYCTDPEADHAFVRDIQLRAADLEPFLRRMRRIKLDSLARP